MEIKLMDLYEAHWPAAKIDHRKGERGWPIAPLELEADACRERYGPYNACHGLRAWELLCSRRGDATVTTELLPLFRELCVAEERTVYLKYKGVEL